MNEKRSYAISHRGFTLLELLVSISIIAVLLVLALNVRQHISASEKRIGCLANLRQLHLVFQQYANDNGNCFPIGVGETAPRTWTSKIEGYLPYKYATQKLYGITYCPATSKIAAGQEPDFLKKRNRSGWFTDYNVNENVVKDKTPNPNNLATIPGNLVLLYDGGGSVIGSPGSNDGSATKRHANRFNVIFVDGHSETLETFDQHKGSWKKE